MPTEIQTKGFLYNEAGQLDVNSMRKQGSLVANGTLSPEAFKKWDDKMVDVARTRLTFAQDLVKYNLVDRSYNLGDIVASYEKLSDMTAANVSMDGATPAERDVLTFTEAGVPIPIFHKDFQLNERQILASARRPGGYLPTTTMATATRIVADKIDSMFWDGIPGIVVDSKQVYGLTNHPDRNTLTISNDWNSGSETPITDVKNMLQMAYDDNFFGPFVLYVSKDNWAKIQEDYSDNKSDLTIKQRIEDFAEISAVRPGDGLADGEVVLVQMTEDVLELKVAQDFVNFQQPEVRKMQYDFTVMAAMALTVKSDKAGRCGIVHATGA